MVARSRLRLFALSLSCALAASTATTSCKDNTRGSRGAEAGSAEGKTPTAERRKPRRGIVGEPAPRWAVAKWFNVPAGAAAPEVASYRDKVVFLFFYQSW